MSGKGRQHVKRSFNTQQGMGNDNSYNKKRIRYLKKKKGGEGGKRNLYEPISSMVNAAATAKPCSSATHVCANNVWSTFKRTASLRPNAEESLASTGVVREEGPVSKGRHEGYHG